MTIVRTLLLFCTLSAVGVVALIISFFRPTPYDGVWLIAVISLGAAVVTAMRFAYLIEDACDELERADQDPVDADYQGWNGQ